MLFISSVWNTFLEALFPTSGSEKVIFSWTPEQALKSLPSSRPPPLENASSIFAYKDPRVTKLIWNIKYKRSEQAVKIGGYALYCSLIDRIDGITNASKPAPASPRPSVMKPEQVSPLIVIPIPITERRRRERGYNQTELLAAEITRLDANHQFHVISSLLIRTQHLSRQTDKSRDERLADARGIFSFNEAALSELISSNSQFKNISIVIIDDVITTGSTMKEAMETFKTAGFNNISALSLAH